MLRLGCMIGGECVNNILFISPSYKRAGKVKVRNVIKDVILAVHEFEEEEYREKNGGELLIIPNNLRGNMARVRNYILEYGFSKSDYIVTLDDDISNIGYYQNSKRHLMTDIKDFVKNGFVMAEDFGFKIWGLNVVNARNAYREYSPISTLGVVLGSFTGHIKNNIRYDIRLGLKEDYDYALQHLRKYKGILRFNKYFYDIDHITLDGGCASYRTKGEEREQIELLQKKWGEKVVQIREDTINPLIHCPLRGI